MNKQSLKSKKFFFIWAAASLLCMIIIFVFSSQNSDESGALSGSLTRRIFEVIKGWFGLSETLPFMDTLEVIVRKTAHLSIYFVLGFCAANAVWQATDNILHIFLISLIWSSFYAATDEWHQYFVPGRSCMWQDWLIDTTGILLGICVAFLIVRHIKNAKKQK